MSPFFTIGHSTRTIEQLVGLLAELLLLEHTESATQWIPLLSLTAGLLTGLAVALRASAATVQPRSSSHTSVQACASVCSS